MTPTATVTARPRLPQEIIDGFREITTSTITDVLFGFGMNCIVVGPTPVASGMKVCGPAFTMRFVPEQDPHTYKTETKLPTILESVTPGDVWVIDNGGRTDSCAWGGHISRMAKTKGVNGVIIDGATRDTAELLEVGLPVFARGKTPLHHHGIVRAVNINTEPISIGTVPRAASVAPGDIVVGDDDGIVVIPSARAAELLELCKERNQHEAIGYDPTRLTWSADRKEAIFRRAEINWGFNRIISAYKKPE